MANRDNRQKRVGLYSTLSFHLAILIILLVTTIHSVSSKETSFVLDFTKQEQLEKEQKEMEIKKDVSKELDQLIAAQSRTKVRNISVDAGQRLKDDRFKNPNEVYDDARELQRKLDASRREAMRQQSADQDNVDMGGESNDKPADKAPAYQGPSVISWSLEGRTKQFLPVPAYKGYGSGDVAVAITVNQKGRVIAAQVIAAMSCSDTQLQEFALEAARRSRFNASTSAPAKQEGEIVYRFIAQ